MTDRIRIVFAVAAFNAGETTRGIEIARAIQEVGAERGAEAELKFVYPRSSHSFDEQIRRAGFETCPADFWLSDGDIAVLMRADHDGDEFVHDRSTGRRFIEACIAEIERHRPDLLVFGFFPPAGIAAQLLGVPSVSYLPFPAHAPWVRRHFLKDLPDELDVAVTAWAPRAVRRCLTLLVARLMTRKRFFSQPTFAAAAKELGWSPPRPDLFAMLDADIQLVNDLPGYYAGEDVGPHTRLTGPLFSRASTAEIPREIEEHFQPEGLPRVFVSLGSSGERPYLLAAIEAVAKVECRAVVVVPPHICSLDEGRSRAGSSPRVLLTEKFVPADRVNAVADFAIIHGGQGTVQTAVSSGTPIVGVGMQMEQTANLDKVVSRGAGIRIARRHWRPPAIARALRRLMESRSYQERASELKQQSDAIDGRKRTGELIWDLATSRRSSNDAKPESSPRSARGPTQ